MSHLKNKVARRTARLTSVLLAVLMILTVAPIIAFPASADNSSTTDNSFYKIVHLDCGRKYFTKNWIVALLYEMKADGYNQLQLAFGNDGLRFLLDDMSFTANGTTYSHATVVSKVEEGNKAQNKSGDASWLTQTEMNEIIGTANELGIEIVPLLNLPGHANAILDIVDDKYNANGSNNTLDVASSDSAVNFGTAIFKKYVDYFAGKGCRFFNFGADEYANDADGTFNFSRLNSTQYAKFVSFINSLADYIKKKGMTPRAFNDGMYYNSQSVFVDTGIQCCYWSSGWGSYPVAAASTISGKGHDMINTHGDFYYVLGKSDKFDSDYSYASNFSNTAFMGSTISNPVGSMFCIWCDYPNAETETEVAEKTRLVLRAMALRMDGKSINNMDTSVVKGGFNEDGTVNEVNPDDSPLTITLPDGMDSSSPSMIVGTSIVLTASEACTWDVDDTNVAKLTSIESSRAAAGSTQVNVTAEGVGTATITATSVEYPEKSATVALAVNDPSNVTVNIRVGDTSTAYPVSENVTAGAIKTGDEYIATAKVSSKPSQTKTVYELVKELKAGTYYVSTKADDTAPTVQLTIEADGTTYYLKNGDTYIYPNATYTDIIITGWWRYSLGTSKDSVTLTFDSGRIEVSKRISSGNSSTTSYLTFDGSSFGADETATPLYLYTTKDVTEKTENTLTFTGTGEGTTEVTVDGVKYTINVEAPKTSIDHTLLCGNEYILKNAEDGQTVEYSITSGDGTYITFSKTGVVKALDNVTGTAVATATVKNAGGYVVAEYTYNITVTPEDLDSVTPLNLEYWITNSPISTITGTSRETRTNSGSNTYTAYFTKVKATASGVATISGIDVSSIAPQSAEHDSRTVYYWRSRLLDKTSTAGGSTSGTDEQTATGGDDDTYSGVSFTRIRYYNSTWSVYTENNEWVNVTANNQLVAYYLEHIKITDEIESWAADWGNKGDGTTGGWLDTYYYCSLSVQVVYEDGTTNPTGTTAGDLKTKSIVYGYWNNNGGRGIGTLMFDGSNYDIYKVTAETGSVTASMTNNSANISSFTWDENEETVWEGLSDNVAIHNSSNGFSSDGIYANLCWNENKEAILIRVYVRAKASGDSLTVEYYDESDNSGVPFYDYSIAVKEGTYFNPNFGMGTTTNSLVNNTVTNINGKVQTVQADLSKMPQINVKYRYAKYTLTKVVKVTENGHVKTVKLYYKFNNVTNIIMDFGLPVNISLGMLSENLTSATITEVNFVGLTYGTAVYDAGNGKIVYTPTSILRARETLGIEVTGQITYTDSDGIEKTQTGTVTYIVYIYPASTVYYEEGFIKGTGWTTATSSSRSYNNAGDLIPGKRLNTPYGYNVDYANDSGYSGGSAMTATVNGSATASASFTFTGTGFDLISETGTGTGVIFLDIYSGTETDVTNRIKRWVVDTYYGYAYEVDKDNPWLECVWTYGVDKKWHVTRTPVVAEGTSEVVPQNPSEGTTFKTYEPNYTWTKTDKGTLKQIPVINFQDLGRGWGTYTVVITAKYNAFFDHTGAGSYTVCIDGVRIYNTLEDSSIYKEDGEYDPEFFEIRDELINSEDVSGNVNGAAFIDAIGTTSKSDLISNYGPNNEVYLAAGQSITFTLTSDNVAKLMLGLKAPNGASGVTVTVNDKTQTTITLGTATDMYYQIYSAASGEKTYNIVITNTGSALVSVTTLKVTHTDSASTQSLLTVNAGLIAEAKAVMLLLIQPEVPVFTPERFEASWTTVTLFRNSVHALVVRTSTDVDHITVDGKEITTFYYAAAFEGWGRNRKLVKYKVFTLFLGNDASTGDYEVVAFDAEGVASEARIATLTGKPGVGKFN